jgi:hypothetical protein
MFRYFDDVLRIHHTIPNLELVRRGSDSMVVGFTATYAISAYRHLK